MFLHRLITMCLHVDTFKLKWTSINRWIEQGTRRKVKVKKVWQPAIYLDNLQQHRFSFLLGSSWNQKPRNIFSSRNFGGILVPRVFDPSRACLRVPALPQRQSCCLQLQHRICLWVRSGKSLVKVLNES